MMHVSRLIAGVTLGVAVLAGAGFAEPTKAVEKPKFEYKTVDGKVVSPETVKGYIVILDFWATWCGPCMKEAPHMVKISKEYADKGVVIVGVSLDDDVGLMRKVAKDQGFTWPQICDGGAWQSPVAKAWGVNSIPQTFILSPDGAVVWRGHPAMIDNVLPEVVKKFPTQVALRNKSLEMLKDAGKILADEKDAEKALAKVADLPEALKADAALTEAARGVMAKLGDEKGKAALAANEVAAKKLAALGTKPVADKPVAAATPVASKSAGAAPALLDSRLALAEKERAAGRDVEAYAAYKWLVERGAGSPQAETAAKQIAAYDADPAFAEKVAKAKRENEAASLLWQAQALEKNDKLDAAKVAYQKVIAQFKDTAAATEAAAALTRLK